MLYECWRQVAQTRGSEVALRNLADGRLWTFGQLAAAAEGGGWNTPPVTFPRAGSASFIIEVLQAWRSSQVVCPLEADQAAPHLNHPLPRDIVHLKTTSATTGAARLVAVTAHQLIADAENICATMGLCPECPNLGVISMAHSYGFSNLVLPLLLHGIPLTVVGAGLPEAVRRAAALQPEFTLAAVPALWRTWHEAGAIPANVRLAISAGAPLPLALEQVIFATHGLKVHNFYGSSECGGIAYDATPKPRTDSSCAGAALRRVHLSVGEDGCLEVRGPAVAHGYWPEPSSNLGVGLFRTSDLAELKHGQVFLYGRATDQINVAGRKVSPETIERALAAHPQVLECVAFGVPSTDAERGESIVACLALRAKVSSEALKQFLMAHLPAWQLPRDWWFVETIPANRQGKLSRREWRRRYLEMAQPNTK